MKAIVLVGGFGTRLKSVLPDLPKPMAPIANRPFLAYLLNYLQEQGMTEIILPVHYMGQKIRDYFNDEFRGMKIHYVVEEEALGTGGAIVNALRMTNTTDTVVVLNGDTFVPLNYRAMYEAHRQSASAFTMALRVVDDCSRYGNVIVEDGVITKFAEKGMTGKGNINAGIYILEPEVFDRFQLPQKFSIELDFLLPHSQQIKPRAFSTENYFIDIGIPEDYQRACQELPAICNMRL